MTLPEHDSEPEPDIAAGRVDVSRGNSCSASITRDWRFHAPFLGALGASGACIRDPVPSFPSSFGEDTKRILRSG